MPFIVTLTGLGIFTWPNGCGEERNQDIGRRSSGDHFLEDESWKQDILSAMPQ
jgi:hypothetical protein